MMYTSPNATWGVCFTFRLLYLWKKIWIGVFLSFIYCLNNTCTERCTVSCISPLLPPYWFYYLVVMKSWFSFFVIYSTKSIFLLHLRNSFQFYLNKRFSTLHASTSWRSRSLQHCNIVLSSFSLWSGLKRVAI